MRRSRAPGQGLARRRRLPSLRGHTLHLPHTWERRPCSATCSPGAWRETLPYTSSEAGALPRRRIRPFPVREPRRRGLARSRPASAPRGWGLPAAEPGGGAAGASSPAALPPPPVVRGASTRGRVRRSNLPRRGSGALPSALAFPAECHCHQSKGKGPAEGVTGGPTRRRTGVARGQGHRMAERRGAGTGGPSPGTAAPATALAEA